jgi:hypothetical protein
MARHESIVFLAVAQMTAFPTSKAEFDICPIFLRHESIVFSAVARMTSLLLQSNQSSKLIPTSTPAGSPRGAGFLLQRR